MVSRGWPAWKRPAKFAFVGAIGIGVQLVMLHLAGGCGYLWATAIAVETAILHNFVWHENFTWADRNRPGSSVPGSRFLRFHLSNGLISIIENVLLMRTLVGGFGMHVLPANLLSITVCCFTNFLASDRWVFVTS
jgi:putative flippase GtrA